MNPPLIFIHYGDSSYLKHTLEAAVFFNPDKRVILLGDRSNCHHAEIGIEHIPLNDFASGPEIELFDKVYRHTAGVFHGRRQWTRFVFRRWFIINNFINFHDIQAFWTFDSDTLILKGLTTQEGKFRDFDCTEQCAGQCMNGFVTNRLVVGGYLEKINELFQREHFLVAQQKSFESLSRYAFTEMGAYVVYRDEALFKHINLNTIIDGETFIESVCTLNEHRALSADEYELYDDKFLGYDLKRIYTADDGRIFMFHRPSQQFVRLVTINMSWVPDCLFGAILKHAKRKPFPGTSQPLDRSQLSLLNPVEICESTLPPPPPPRQKLVVSDKLLDKLKKIQRKDPNIYPLY